jgi:hypothetical protein
MFPVAGTQFGLYCFRGNQLSYDFPCFLVVNHKHVLNDIGAVGI